jgi:hypothetical protein
MFYAFHGGKPAASPETDFAMHSTSRLGRQTRMTHFEFGDMNSALSDIRKSKSFSRLWNIDSPASRRLEVQS